MIAVALWALAVSYIGSYYHLSRRGMREAEQFGIPGFIYISYQEYAATENLGRHFALARLYSPLNWLDQTIFGAPGPAVCLLRLSG